MIPGGVYLSLDYKINHLYHSSLKKFLTAPKKRDSNLNNKIHQNELKNRIFDAARKY